MERPKRAVNKPSRYQTTSSEDERPGRSIKRACPSTMSSAEIEEDIDDIRRILEEQAKDKNVICSQPEKQYSKDYPQISTNASPHTYTYQPPYTSTTYTTLPTSHTLTYNHNNYAHSSTHIPTHTHTHAHTGEVMYNTTYETQFQANVDQGSTAGRSSSVIPPTVVNYPTNEISRNNEKINR